MIYAAVIAFFGLYVLLTIGTFSNPFIVYGSILLMLGTLPIPQRRKTSSGSACWNPWRLLTWLSFFLFVFFLIWPGGAWPTTVLVVLFAGLIELEIYYPNTWRRLFDLRYQIIIAAFLFILPVVATSTGARPLLRNLFDMPDALSFGIVVFLSLHASTVLLTAFELTLIYGDERSRDEVKDLANFRYADHPDNEFIRRSRLYLAYVLALPTIVTIWWHTDPEVVPIGMKAVAVLSGYLLALITVAVIVFFRERWTPNYPPLGFIVNPLQFLSWLAARRLWSLPCLPEYPPPARRLRRWTGKSVVLDREFDVEYPVDKLPSIRAKELLAWLGMRHGYFRYNSKTNVTSMAVGHFSALAVLLITLLLYALGYYLLRPGGLLAGVVPALGFILVLVILSGSFLPAAAFWLDRWRSPILLIIIGFSFVAYSVHRLDHHYLVLTNSDLIATESRPEMRLAPVTAARAAKKHHEGTVIVVAASGGGITAAAWTAQVLTRLEEELGQEFTQHLMLISAVSGGSVGTMFYLDGFDRDVPRSTDDLKSLRSTAAASSLSATGWGMTYPDLWRFVMPSLMSRTREQDRAWAIEQDWQESLSAQQTLLEQRQPIREGQLPIPIYQGVTVEEGTAFLLTPIDLVSEHPLPAAADDKGVEAESLPVWGDFGLYRGFRELYPHCDIRLATAARLSATFPWVTPVSRPSDRELKRPFHVADGGYFDNFGVAAAAEWVNALLIEQQEDQSQPSSSDSTTNADGSMPLIRRVIFVEIRAWDTKHQLQTMSYVKDDDFNTRRGWQYEVIGPISTLTSVRTSSQIARNERLLALLSEKCKRRFGIPFHRIECVYHPDGDWEPPLSWHLSVSEQKRIADGWIPVWSEKQAEFENALKPLNSEK